jgi:hypothetical protein
MLLKPGDPVVPPSSLIPAVASRGRGEPHLCVFVCLNPRVFRFLSFLCQYDGRTNVDGAC